MIGTEIDNQNIAAITVPIIAEMSKPVLIFFRDVYSFLEKTNPRIGQRISETMKPMKISKSALPPKAKMNNTKAGVKGARKPIKKP